MRYSSFLAAIVSLFLFPLLISAQEDPAKKITLTWDQLQQREVPRIKIYVISTATDLDNIPGNDSTRIVRGRRNREFLVRVDHSPAVKETFRGSPYLYAAISSAALTDRSGETYERVPLRYDLYKDRLEYLKEGRPVTLNPSDVPAFVFLDSLTGQPRRFRNGFEPPDDLELHRTSYFEVLYDGPTKLLRHLRKVPFNQVDGSPHNAILNKGVYTFSSIEEELFLLKNGVIIPVKPRRSQLLNALQRREEELIDFIKNNNIDTGSPAGIKQLLLHYDQLERPSLVPEEREK